MKKKILISLLIILVVLLFSLILFKYLYFNTISTTKEEVKVELTDDRVKELLYDSYVYYILSSGNIPTLDVTINLDDEKYYGIDLNVDSLDDINNIIDDMIVNERKDIIINDIYGNDRSFYYDNGVLFTNNIINDEKCDINEINYNGNYKIINTDDGNYQIEYDMYDTFNTFITVSVMYEDGKWKLYDVIPMCIND